MQYEPIKRSLGRVFNNNTFFRIFFYKLLDILLLRTWYVKRELKIVRKSIGNVAKVLDAGSGFGQYTYYLSTISKGWKITGTDIEEAQILDCNSFFKKLGISERIEFVKADLTQFVSPEEYDLIISVDVMEHILDDIQVFKNFYQSLKSKGALIISTPSNHGGSDVHDDHEKSFIAEHVRDGYSTIDIENKLKEAGFSNIKTKYSYGKPGQISWKLSMKYPITLLNVSKLFFVILPFYYLVSFPFCLVLNYLDLTMNQNIGTGLIVKAVK
jgi:2-polyprenyl-3-methyl-5-hydroxy-6-metoxy-1,4-benzoquinol methylase